jgi:hypothetical protein
MTSAEVLERNPRDVQHGLWVDDRGDDGSMSYFSNTAYYREM